MSTVLLKILGVSLLAGALPLRADEAGKAAAKGYAHAAAKPASASPRSPAAKENGAAARPSEALPGAGRMQVEEPAAAAQPGANESKAWQKSHPKGLTDAQKTAFRERKEKMEGMIALIKAKRQALRDAKPEERAAIARELHVLILEKDGEPATVTTAAARVEDKSASESEVGTRKQTEAQAASDAQAQRREELRERQSERERHKAWKSKDEED
jgi:hypothetical protein